MIYKKGKLFGLFNIIDVAILLIVVAAVFGFVMKSGILEKVSLSTNDRNIEVTFRIERIKSENASGYKVGDTLTDTETGASLGQITAVRQESAQDIVTKADGSAVLAAVPKYVNVYITIQGEGTKTALGNFINGNRHVAPGGKVNIGTYFSRGGATVMKVESQEK